MGIATRMGRSLGDAARIVAGVGCYDAYLKHMRDAHPAAAPMTEVDFFRDRQEARFGGGGPSSCC